MPFVAAGLGLYRARQWPALQRLRALWPPTPASLLAHGPRVLALAAVPTVPYLMGEVLQRQVRPVTGPSCPPSPSLYNGACFPCDPLPLPPCG